MAVILSIETATNVCSVALHDDGQLLGHQELFVAKSHSGLLTVLINDLVKYCGLELDALESVAVSEGPGSYTGLRIGVSTAKGLCYSLGIPMIAVNTLEAMAHHMMQFVQADALLCPMLDARRMEVYYLLSNTRGDVLEETQPKVIDELAFKELLNKKRIVFFGNGAAKCDGVIVNSNATFIESVTPTAESIGNLAYRKFANSEFVDVAYFEPFYLKDFRPTTPRAIAI